jgi:Zn ribbon nucleic-acid-binding protein
MSESDALRHAREQVRILRRALIHIREIADGRRHYDDCFGVLGEIRALCDTQLMRNPPISESVQPLGQNQLGAYLDDGHEGVQSIARSIVPRTVVKGENCPKCPLSAATLLARLEGGSKDLRKCMECGRHFVRKRGGELVDVSNYYSQETDFKVCWNCDQPADGKPAPNGAPMCRECNVYLEAGCPSCKDKDATLQRCMERGGVDLRCCNCGAEFSFCGNCDVPGLIPEGKTAADCFVCEGTGIVKVKG